jgi:hypothetical protein
LHAPFLLIPAFSLGEKVKLGDVFIIREPLTQSSLTRFGVHCANLSG